MATLAEQIREQESILGRSGRKSTRDAAQKKLQELNRQRVQTKVDQKKAKEERLKAERRSQNIDDARKRREAKGIGRTVPTQPTFNNPDIGSGVAAARERREEAARLGVEATATEANKEAARRRAARAGGESAAIEDTDATQVAGTVDGTPDAQTADEVIMSTEEERRDALLDEPFREATEFEMEEFGEAQGPTSFDAAKEEAKAAVVRERESQERKADLQEQSIRDQAETAQRGAMQQVTAAEQVFGGVDREGPVDVTGARTGVQRFRDRAQRQLTRIEERRNAAFADVERFREDIIRAERAGNRQLANEIRKDLAAAENELVRMDTEYLGALDRQEEREQQRLRTGLQQFDSLRESLGNAGMAAIGPDVLSGILVDAGLPGTLAPSLIQAHQNLAEAEAAGNEMEIAQAQADLYKTYETAKTPDQRNAEFLERLISNGASPEVINSFKELAGIDMGAKTTNVSGGTMSYGDFGSQEIPKTFAPTNSVLGPGQVTGYGSDKWAEGLDFVLEGGTNAEVVMPFEFVVEEIDDQSTGFGRRVKIKNVEDGKQIWVSHLSEFGNIQEGETYNAGQSIGKQGNSGDVIDMGGGGVHLDITMPNGEGGYFTPEQVASYFNVGGEPIDADAFESAVSLLTPDIGQAAMRDEIRKDLNQFIANGDAKNARQLIRNATLSTYDAPERKKIRGNMAALDLLQQIESDLSDLTEDEQSEVTGLLSGKTQKLQERLGRAGNEELAKVANKIAVAIQQYRQAVSGAAFTESEQKEYKAIFPSIENKWDLNKAKIDSLKDVLTGSVESAFKSNLGVNYNSVFPNGVMADYDLIQDSEAGQQLDYEAVAGKYSNEPAAGAILTDEQRQYYIDNNIPIPE